MTLNRSHKAVSHLGISFLFGSQEEPGSQQDPGGARKAILGCFGRFPLVSDGPMVRDLCN